MIFRFPESNVKAFLVIWGLFLAGILALAGIFLINRMAGSDKIIQAQLKQYEVQTKQIGQPTTIIQRYESPMK